MYEMVDWGREGLDGWSYELWERKRAQRVMDRGRERMDGVRYELRGKKRG